MKLFAFFFLCLFSILLAQCAAEDLPIKACKPDDIACLGEAAREFVENTANGLPSYNCKPVDPVTLDTMQFEQPEVKITLTNIQISGMKGLKLVGFRLDETAKRTEFNMTMILDVAQDIKMEFTDPKKTFTGKQTGKINVECRTGYNWEVVKDDIGEHYLIAPETTTCEILSMPELTLNPELQTQLKNDAQIDKNWEERKDQINEQRKKNVAKVAEKAFAVLIENFRNAAKKLPTSAFITKE